MSYKPEGHSSVSPYLLVPNVSESLRFIEAVFGAKPHDVIHGDGGVIRHAAVMIDDSIVMLGQMAGGGGYNVHVYVPDVDETYAKAIRAGGTSFEEPAPQFYGDRRGAVTDPGDVTWWLATRMAAAD